MSRSRAGAAAGAAAIGVYLAGASVMPREPDFDASAAQVAAFFDQHRTRIQIGCAVQALWPPLLLWFLATVRSAAAPAGEAATRAANVALGAGLVFAALFLADVASLAVAALRPENMLATPEVAASLRDFSWLVMGMATPTVCALAAALATIALRHDAIWPRWVGWLAVAAGAAYALRLGTLFTTTGPFAADGVLGLWAPVISIAGLISAASAVLFVRTSAAR